MDVPRRRFLGAVDRDLTDGLIEALAWYFDTPLSWLQWLLEKILHCNDQTFLVVRLMNHARA